MIYSISDPTFKIFRCAEYTCIVCVRIDLFKIKKSINILHVLFKVMTKLDKHTEDPFKLPDASEQVIFFIIKICFYWIHIYWNVNIFHICWKNRFVRAPAPPPTPKKNLPAYTVVVGFLFSYFLLMAATVWFRTYRRKGRKVVLTTKTQ